MLAGAVRSAFARVSLTRALVALGVLLVAIIVGDAIWDIRVARDRTERRAQRDFTNLTNLLTEQTAASLHAADLIMREAQRAGSVQQAAAAMPRMREELLHIPQIAAF